MICFINKTVESGVGVMLSQLKIKYRNQCLDMVIGAAGLYLGGAAMQHWLAYYRYPYMRCITLFEEAPDSNKEETVETAYRI